MEHINPLNDYIFQKILGEQGAEEQCIAFINAVLKDSKESPLRLVKILENRTLTPEILGNKANILDFRA